MTRRKITVTLDPSSIDKAIRELKAEKKWREDKIAELTKALAEMGAEETGYDSRVSVKETETGAKIIASGKGIAFIEFGAGDTAVFMTDVDGIDLGPGTWSSSELGSGEYARTGKWHFGGKEYTEIQPQRGMMKAEEAILARVREIAERVFRDG